MSCLYNTLHLYSAIQLSSQLLCELYYLHVITQGGSLNTLKLGHSPKVTWKDSEEFRAHETSISLSRRYSRLFCASRIKTWKKIHCNMWGDVLDKAKGYSWLLVTRLHSISEKGQNDIEIKKVLNVKNPKSYLKCSHHFRNNLQYVVARPSRLNFFQTPEHYNPYT